MTKAEYNLAVALIKTLDAANTADGHYADCRDGLYGRLEDELGALGAWAVRMQSIFVESGTIPSFAEVGSVVAIHSRSEDCDGGRSERTYSFCSAECAEKQFASKHRWADGPFTWTPIDPEEAGRDECDNCLL